MKVRLLAHLSLYGILSFSSFARGADETIPQDIKSDLRYVVDRVDELLGGKRTDDNKNESTLRLTTSQRVADREKPELSFDVGFILKLESLTRWQEAIQNWFHRRWEDLQGDSDAKRAARAGKPLKGDDGVKKDPWRFSFDKHLTLGSKIDFQIHPRLRKDFEGKYLLHSFLAQFGWSIKQQWDSQLAWVASVRTHKKFLVTWTNSIQWAITDRIMSTTHGPGFSYLLSEHQALSGASVVNTNISRTSWGVESYATSLTYRFEAAKDWMFISLTPFINFVRLGHFHRDLGFVLSLETVF